MNRLAFVFLAGCALFARGDDPFSQLNAPPPLLDNGDFSNGLAHWQGAVKTPPDDADGTPGTGAGISLLQNQWVMATREFELPPGRYTLHVTVSFLPDTKFSTYIPDYISLQQKLGIPDSRHFLEVQPGQWVAAIIDRTNLSYFWWHPRTSATAGDQSYSFTIANIDSKNEQSLLLAFPPGDGEVVLRNVSIVPLAGGQEQAASASP